MRVPASRSKDKENMIIANIDLHSRMYPALEEIHRLLCKEHGSKPFVMCEFCHAMGNGPGDLEDNFQVYPAVRWRLRRFCMGVV